MKRHPPELIDSLRATLRNIEQDEDQASSELQRLKRKVLLLLSKLELKKNSKHRAA
jgi:hypothetical protein